jgi:hypothetical protein
MTRCDHPTPGVPSTPAFPTPPGWPKEISPERNGLAYHDYDVGYPMGAGGSARAAAVEAAVVQNPTPDDHDRAATANGTPNSAGRIVLKEENPVISYEVTLPNGRRGVLNVTQPGHAGFPGYAFIYPKEDPRTGEVSARIAGEGANWMQGNWNGLARWLEGDTWKRHTDEVRSSLPPR